MKLFWFFVFFFLHYVLEAQTRMGCKIDTSTYFRSVLPAYNALRGDEILPKAISLKNFCPTPRNQGEYGTCVAWTSAYYARSIMLAQNYVWERKDLDTKAGSPFFVYEHIKAYSDKNCQEGAGLIVALEALKQYGTLPYEDFSQKCGQKILPEYYSKAEFYKIGEYRRLFLANSKDKILPVKKTLSQRKPVVIGLFCYFKSFIHCKDSLWQPTENELNNWNWNENGHALCLIGYDDELQAFEAVNSWGEKWANKGFVWIPYKVFEKVCFEAYEMYENNDIKTQIAGEVRLQLAIGQEIPVRLKEGFYESSRFLQAGTLLKLSVFNQEPVFLYVFSFDNLGKISRIFPTDFMNSPLLYPFGQLSLPDEKHYIQLSTQSSTDYICLLFCKEKLHWQSFAEQIVALEGTLWERLQKILGSKLVPWQEINFQELEKIKFGAKTQKGNILPIIIAIPKKQ
ncbi:MAG: C1 family peptidase [Raineya sp.]|nr:C1 family peptidase [Raineya sp.]